ncbi:MAG: hypothetical protein A2V88_12015 [Elusimicrobia bacterium RBG_16_66_12]|nr:MAG: hypothetical protein A2V88_12015 [Elusimicrobia bacterium RBG_16_66_12]
MNKLLLGLMMGVGMVGLGRGTAQAASSDTYKCTDSDGGYKFAALTTKGTVTVEVTGTGGGESSAPRPTTATDSCVGKKLKEYYCKTSTSKTISETLISCGYRQKCEYGACVDRN